MNVTNVNAVCGSGREVTVSSLTQEATTRVLSVPERTLTAEVLKIDKGRGGNLWVLVADNTGVVTVLIPVERLGGCNPQPTVGTVLRLTVRTRLRQLKTDWYWIATGIHLLEQTGPLLRRRATVLRELVAEEVISHQRRYDFTFTENQPVARFLKVRQLSVLTTRKGGAGWEDFRAALPKPLQRTAVVQHLDQPGKTTAQQCIEALSRFRGARTDLVVIVRGGGSLEDLRQFDDPDLARAIHGCAVPVAVAVGHITDVSLADRAAYAAFRTPSSAGEHLTKVYGMQHRPPREPHSLSKPLTVAVASDKREAEAVQAVLSAVRTDNVDLRSALATVNQDRNDVWGSLDSHLVSAACDRVRRRSAALSLLSMLVALTVVWTVARGPVDLTSQQLVLLSLAGALASVTALYLWRGRNRGLQPPDRRQVARQANTSDEWIRRMSVVRSPRELRALLSRRPRGAVSP